MQFGHETSPKTMHCQQVSALQFYKPHAKINNRTCCGGKDSRGGLPPPPTPPFPTANPATTTAPGRSCKCTHGCSPLLQAINTPDWWGPLTQDQVESCTICATICDAGCCYNQVWNLLISACCTHVNPRKHQKVRSGSAFIADRLIRPLSLLESARNQLHSSWEKLLVLTLIPVKGTPLLIACKEASYHWRNRRKDRL
jgi:hypothetical protein